MLQFLTLELGMYALKHTHSAAYNWILSVLIYSVGALSYSLIGVIFSSKRTLEPCFRKCSNCDIQSPPMIYSCTSRKLCSAWACSTCMVSNRHQRHRFPFPLAPARSLWPRPHSGFCLLHPMACAHLRGYSYPCQYQRRRNWVHSVLPGHKGIQNLDFRANSAFMLWHFCLLGHFLAP